MPNLASFFAYTILTAFTPGPNNLIALSSTSQRGLKKSLRLILGIYAGFLAVMVLCSAFSVMLVSFIPKIKPVMTYIGAAYILWLAWHIAWSKPQGESAAGEKSSGFLTGFTLQFVNVKIILYGITAISTFVTPYYQSPAAYILFTLLLAVIGWAGTFSWSICGALFQKLFARYGKVLNIVMALLLVYCAVTLALH